MRRFSKKSPDPAQARLAQATAPELRGIAGPPR
jgi:hypothetical protein